MQKLKTKTRLNRLTSNFQNAQTGEKNFVDDIVAAGMKISKIPSMKSTCFDCERDTCQSDQFLPKWPVAQVTCPAGSHPKMQLTVDVFYKER